MFEAITARIPNSVIREEDSYILGIMTQWVSGKNQFIPFRSGQNYDEIRPYLLHCYSIDTSAEPDICNAYWDILPRERAAAMAI